MSNDFVGKILTACWRLKALRIECYKNLRESRLTRRLGRDLIGCPSARQSSRHEVQHQGEPRAFPVTDGQRAFRGLDCARHASQMPFGIEPSLNR